MSGCRLKLRAADPLVQLAVPVRKSTLDLLSRYADFHKEETGFKPGLDALVDGMLRNFMDEDPEFVKFLNTRQYDVKEYGAYGRP